MRGSALCSAGPFMMVAARAQQWCPEHSDAHLRARGVHAACALCRTFICGSGMSPACAARGTVVLGSMSATHCSRMCG